MSMNVSWLIVLMLAAAPRRVTDDSGCNKGIDADNELDGEITCTRGGQKTYEGLYSHGKRVGLAKSWTEGVLRSVDRFVDGKRNGVCESYDREGAPEEACTYKDDVKAGPCKLYGRAGKLREERNYVQGEQRGPYVEYFENGQVRERGTLDGDGRRHGLFERFFENGSPEESQAWVHGQREGLSKEWHRNGKLRREQAFKNDQEHGLGRSFHETGQLAEVTCFQNGESQRGTGVCTGKTGTEVVTRFSPDGKPVETTVVRDGKRNGEYQVFRDGQLTLSQSWVDDRLDGLEKRFKTGTLQQQISWKAGKRHGPETVWFDDGKVSEERLWKDGVQTSLTTYWMNAKKKHAELLEGALWRMSDWYDNGQLSSEAFVADGYGRRREGVSKTWAENGTLLTESTFKGGQRHGPTRRFFDQTGKLESEETWVVDVRVSLKVWDEQGVLTKDVGLNPDGSRKP
jgi:uncharacterized protein